MAGETILLVDDDEARRSPIARHLTQAGYRVREASTAAAARQLFSEARPELVLLDQRLADGDGLDLLRALKAVDDGVPLLMCTSHASIDLGVTALEAGAEQLLVKPVDLKVLERVVRRVLEGRRAQRVVQAVRARESRERLDPFVGESPAIVRLGREASQLLATNVAVMIEGEPGTGKGVLAAWLHREGSRANESFVDLNCAGPAQPLESESAKPGLLELAHRGTLFLDAVGDLSLEVQAKLLQALEQRLHDVRLISATHRDLAALAEASRFRRELLHRLDTVSLVMPSLRDRGGDVVLLARALAMRLGGELGRPALSIDGDAEALLSAHPWPGNVRELRNVLERAAMFTPSERLDRSVIERALARPQRSTVAPHASPPRRAAPRTLREAESDEIRAALQRLGNVEAAANVLGLSRSALYQKMRKHGLRRP